MAIADVTAVQGASPTEIKDRVQGTGVLTDFDQFLTLFVEQLKNQDPLDPVSNEDFMAQTAQFSALEQLVNLNQKVETANATDATTGRLNAASLIGRTVTAATGEEESVTSRVLAVDLSDPGEILLGLEDGSVVSFGDVTSVFES